MTHAQKPDFVFRRNGRVHLNRRRVRQFSSTAGSRGVRISGSNAGYTVFRGGVKGTGYPFHSPFSPSIPLSCFTLCYHISTGPYRPYKKCRIRSMPLFQYAPVPKIVTIYVWKSSHQEVPLQPDNTKAAFAEGKLNKTGARLETSLITSSARLTQ